MRAFLVKFDRESGLGTVSIRLNQDDANDGSAQGGQSASATEPSAQPSQDAIIDFNVSESGFSALSDVGGMVAIDEGGWKIVLIRNDVNSVICLDRLCPHEGAEMVKGKEGQWDSGSQQLICTRHGSFFKKNGELASGPSPTDIAAHPVEFEESSGTGRVTLTVSQSGESP